jgi:formylglycine-generating enzyme required for sulfatase activity
MTYDPNNFQDQAAIAAMLQRQKMINSQNQLQSIPANRKCPWCGGLLPGQYSKCQHCASEVSWVNYMPYKPKDAEYVQSENLKRWKKQQATEKWLKAEAKKLESEIAARVVFCKKCTCRVPQTDLINTVNTCKKCADSEKLISIIVAIAVLIVIVTLINVLRAHPLQNQLLVYINIAIAALTVIVTLLITSRVKNQHKQFVESKAKAEHQVAEKKARAKARAEQLAKAKEEQLATEAKAKLGEISAESKAKLANEIGTGRVGVTLGMPLGGILVMPFAFCPAGSFTMGSPPRETDRSSNENQVSVTLSKAFWMAKTEVTQAQWRAVMGSNPSHFVGDDLPVETVSWGEAQEFIKMMNYSGVLPSGWKMALPTEAQWEYACRAGETGAYSGGTVDQVAWSKSYMQSKTNQVGKKKPNLWGLHDMHGNVWEWCADWYADKLVGGTDPSGTALGNNRVRRGGSWNNIDALCRAAYRGSGHPDLRNYVLGFRPALVQSE